MVWCRFDPWAKDGTFDKVPVELQGQAQAGGDLEWVVSVDSTIARAILPAGAQWRASLD
jgi:hypothetical protein